jgi:hypothetical protein
MQAQRALTRSEAQERLSTQHLRDWGLRTRIRGLRDLRVLGSRIRGLYVRGLLWRLRTRIRGLRDLRVLGSRIWGLHVRDLETKFIRICNVILSIQFKCRAPRNTGPDILSTRIQNSNGNNQVLSWSPKIKGRITTQIPREQTALQQIREEPVIG